eukprot:TRINITY_DN10732_c0_g3_i1.p1 TRINITY_DN10732_c0_g3~~TRINITY_DN10732_c0_g3_i1.p1  ORF type:complete len:1882 (+),score=531.56 TRINITY_DN10732_c0_g3_i1:135-5648(+)
MAGCGGCFSGLLGASTASASAPARGPAGGEEVHAFAERVLAEEADRLTRALTQRLRTFEVGLAVQAQARMEKTAASAPFARSDRDVEALRLRVFQMELHKRRRSQQVGNLRKALSKVRRIFLDENCDPKEEANLEATQLQAEIRAERERWTVEKRTLQDQIRSLEAEMQMRNSEVECDLEMKKMKRQVQQLQLSIESKDRYACWVCMTQKNIRASWGHGSDNEDDDSRSVASSSVVEEQQLASQQRSSSEACLKSEIAGMEDKITELQRELRQIKGVTICEEVSTVSVSPHGRRPSRERMQTPWPGDEASAAASAERSPVLARVSDEPVSVEEVPVADDVGLRRCRTRMPTPYICDDSLAQREDAEPRLVHFSSAEVVSEEVPASGSLRSVRGRTPTGFVDAEPEVAAPGPGEGGGGSSGSTEGRAEDLRRPQGRKGTGFVRRAPGEAQVTVALGPDGMPVPQASGSVSFDLRSPEVAEVPLASGGHLRSVRGRTPTGFIADEEPPGDEARAADGGGGGGSGAVGFETRDDVTEVRPAVGGDMRDIRGRTPTRFEATQQPQGVHFARGHNELHVPVAAAGTMRSLRGRVPTGYVRSDNDAGDGAAPIGLTVHFEDGCLADINQETFTEELLDQFRQRGVSEAALAELLVTLHDGSITAVVSGTLAATAELRSALLEAPQVVVCGFAGHFVEEDGTPAGPSSISFNLEDAVVSPLASMTSGHPADFKSSRGRVPTAFEASPGETMRVIRFADLEEVGERMEDDSGRHYTGERGRGFTSSTESASQGLYRSPSRNSTTYSRASSRSSRSSCDDTRSESCSDAGEGERSDRSRRLRANTPFLSNSQLGFEAQGVGVEAGESSENLGSRKGSDGSSVGSGARVRRKSNASISSSSRGSRKLLKQVSIESHAEREISERVKRSMQRQAREDRVCRLKPAEQMLGVEEDRGWDRVRKVMLKKRRGAISGLEERPEHDLDHRLVEGFEKDVSVLLAAFQALDIFESLDQDDLEDLIDAMQVYEYKDDENAVLQGDTEGSHFFVIATGQFVVVKDGKEVVELGPGRHFGESALLLFGERSATVKARGPSSMCYAIEGTLVRDMLRDQYEEKYAALTQAVDEVLSCADIEMLQTLSSYQLQSLYDRAEMRVFEAGEALLSEGDTEVEFVHVLLSGSVSMTSRGVSYQRLGRFAMIGDRSLVFNEVTGTYVADCETQTLALSRDLLEEMFGDQLVQVLMKNRILGILCNHEVFGRLHEEQREAVAQCCQIVTLAPGEEMEQEDDICFVAMLFGEVSTGQHRVELGAGSPISPGSASPVGDVSFRRYSGVKGDCFGEEYLSQRAQPWDIRVRGFGHTDARLAVWKSVELDAVLKFEHLDWALEQEDKVRTLRSIFVFRTLSKQQLVRLASVLVIARKAAGEKIVRQGDIGAHFYIIRRGVVSIEIDGKKIRTSSQCDYFGERALLYDEPRSATVVADEDCELWIMDKATFQQEIKGSIFDYLTQRIALQDTRVSLEDLRFVKVIGRGGFAVVKMVQSATTKVRYALKCVKKRDAVEKGVQDALVCERSILAEVDHPFIIKFVRSFSAKMYVYFLQELVSGGELLDVLDILGLLKHDHAQFYTGSIVLALEYLHARRIAYLDLKSENCLIDHQGYLKIIDFGIAQKITSGRCLNQKGTPMFMAPEMILLKGYNTTADLWSLGVNVYEFVIGKFPFANHCKTTSDIFQEVVKAELQFPSWYSEQPHSKETIAFIRGLLSRDPAKRLGSSGYSVLKDHSFFKGFSWDDLLGRNLTPPHVPKCEVYAEDKEATNPAEEDGPLQSLESVEKEANNLLDDGSWEDPKPGWDCDF